MADHKLTINDVSGKTIQKEIKDTSVLMGKRIGETIKGDDLGFAGYEFIITGGSDYCGFPMRKGVAGSRRKRILIGKSTGFSGKLRRLRKGKPYRRKPGLRRKKSVCPDGISDTIVQVNMKVVKKGNEDLFGQESKTAEVSPEQSKNDTKAEEKKVVEKQPEVRVEKNDEEPKKEVKTEDTVPAEEKKVKEAVEEPKKDEKAEDSAPAEEKKVKEAVEEPKKDEKKLEADPSSE